MNKVIEMGRLTADPEVRQNGETKVAKYTLAVDRVGKDAGADFIRCVAFNKAADFAEKYLTKGTKVLVEGRLQTGSYDDKDGKKVYTTDVIVSNQEFCEKKADAAPAAAPAQAKFQEPEWMNIPEGQEDLPFGQFR